MGFIILSVMLLYNGKNKSVLLLIFGIFSSIIALYLRLDKILIIISLISLYFEPIKGSISNIYKKIFIIIKKNIFLILLHISIIISSLSLIFLRHYFLIGEFVFVHPSSMAITMNYSIDYKLFNWIKVTYYVLSAADFWPDKPKFPSIVLFIGIFYLISLNIWRNKKIENKIPSSISIISFTIIISFYFFYGSAYQPRWSTHILPFATIGFIYLVFNLIPSRITSIKK